MVVEFSLPWRRWTEYYPWDQVSEPTITADDDGEGTIYKAIVIAGSSRLVLRQSYRRKNVDSDAARFQAFAELYRRRVV